MEINIDKKEELGCSVLENTGVPIIVLDTKGRIVLFNPASEKLSGYRFSEIKGQYFWEMLSVMDDADSIREIDMSILVEEIQRGAAVRRTFCWQDKHGKNHFTKWVVTPLFSNNEILENIILTGLDETDHHRSELTLADSEEQYRDIVEASQQGIWSIDADNCTTFVNARITDMLGYRVEEILRKSILEFMEEQGQEKAKNVLERLKKGINEQHAIKLQHKNGTSIWAQMNMTPLKNKQGAYIGAMAIITDISERKQTEKELANVQRMLTQANDLAKMGAWEFKLGLQELVWSEITKRIHEVDLDYKPDIKTAINFYKEGQHRDTIKRIVENAIEHGEPWDVELIIVTAKGNEKWVRAIGHADFVDNTCQRLYGSFQDITAQKVAELEFERIFELSPDIIGTGNLQGYFTSVNSAVKEKFGYEAKEFCVKPFLEFVHKDDVEKTLIIFQGAQRGKKKLYVENRYICKDGSIKWIAWNILALAEENKFYATGRDFTDRKLVEDALRESELWMKNIYNSLEEAVLVVSPERELINVNQAASAIFGYTQEEIMSRSTELFHVDHQHYLKFGEIINQAFRKNMTANFEFVAKRKNGEIFPSEHTVSLLKNPDGKIVGIVSVVRDITERKNAQNELEKHRANLEDMVAERTFELRNAQDELVRKERLATLGQLTATVSHELRNPLAAMRPSIYLIKRYLGENADKILVNAIERLDRNIARCDQIIDELLDFTRIAKLKKQEILIDQWLDSVMDEHIVMDNVHIQKNYSLEGIEVSLDTNRLQRVIINLIENAYQAMHSSESGPNVITEACLKIETRADGDRIEISISDTGPGIPEDVLPKIFDPLFSTKNFGVGLGMPTARQIMIQHGGGIDISTSSPKGTTVTLWFPR